MKNIFFIVLLFFGLYLKSQNISEYVHEINYHFDGKNYDSTLIYISLLKNILNEKDRDIFLDISLKESYIFYDQIDIKKSIPHNLDLYKNYKNYLTRKNPSYLYKICNYLGSDFAFSGDNNNAIKYLLEAFEINNFYKLKESGILLNLYQYYLDNLNYSLAYNYINQYVNHCKNVKDTLGLANANFCIGKIYQKLSLYKKSIEYYQMSLDLFYYLKRYDDVYKPLVGIGNTYLNIKEYNHAIEYYKKCLVLNIPVENKKVIIINLLNCYIKKNQIDSSKYYIKEYNKLDNSKNNIDFKDLVAEYYHLIGENSKSIRLLKENISQNLKLNNPEILLFDYKTIGYLYKNDGNYKIASEFLDKAIILQDSIFNKKIKVLDSLAVSYVEEKNNFIIENKNNELIKKDNIIQKNLIISLIILILLIILYLIGIYIYNKLIKEKRILKKQADEEKEYYETFKYSVSHDLRNPFMNIQNNLNELSSNLALENNEPLIQKVNSINFSLSSINSLINRLKDLNLTNETQIFESNVECNSLVQEVINDYDFMIKKSNISIEIQNLPIIYTDKILIKNVFENLISNSIKFVQNKQNPKINIIFEQNRLKIIDNGIPLKDQDLNMIFEPFYKVKNNENNGNGLGLYIVKLICKKLNIKIEIYNNDFDGVTASLDLSKCLI